MVELQESSDWGQPIEYAPLQIWIRMLPFGSRPFWRASSSPGIRLVCTDADK